MKKYIWISKRKTNTAKKNTHQFIQIHENNTNPFPFLFPNPKTEKEAGKRKKDALYLPPTCPFGTGLIHATAPFNTTCTTPIIQKHRA